MPVRASQASAHPAVAPLHASRTVAPIVIDGRLDDEPWRTASAVTGFLQKDPDEGQPATEQTELRILYDDEAIYIGARLFDSEPDRIVRQLSRRDAVAEADKLSIFLDPRHDHVTGAEFRVSAAGVQRDAVIHNDTYSDESWDAVWASAVTIDPLGWVVEMRIPLSQLRFPRGDRQTWGINAERTVWRKNEVSWLALVPKNESGLASRMAHLEGVGLTGGGKHLELLPYVSSRAEFIDPGASGNPFNDGTRVFAGAGLDLKSPVGSNLTLNGTVNPDFGQVEVDPAVVNLTAFETFFEEKRPFFTEGSQIFSRFGRRGASEYVNFFYFEPQIFYPRRIGRAPQGRAVGLHVDTPAATTILGAAKLTGQLANGWTVGILDAVTSRETATVSDGLDRRNVEVEPPTNYFVGRAEGAIGSRASLGVLGTMVQRDAQTESLEAQLVNQAYVLGTDGHLFLDGRRDWVISGRVAGSVVAGTRAAVARVQLASQRYFQRPDTTHVRFDPQRTSLAGWTGDLFLNKNSGNVTVNAAAWGMSPGFETNDLGFSTQSDRGGGHGLVLFRKLQPDRWTRSRQISIAKWWTWNWDGDSQGDGVQTTANLQFLNYWRFNTTLGWSKDTWDDRLTRGGPTTVRPGIRTVNASIVSDGRQRLTFNAFGTLQERNFGNWTHTFGGGLSARPSDAVTISIGPQVLRAQQMAQYLATVPDPLATATYGARYEFGELAQTEVSMPTRVNVVLSPTLSVQAYVQPLVSTGDYGAIKELARPRTYDFTQYGVDAGTIETLPGGAYRIDPDGAGPASPFLLPRPDFNFKSLRVNAILRWEFRPGSALFVVWTEQRQNTANPGDFVIGRDFNDLLSADPDDVFLVKMTVWLGR
jgi:Domain of unknown function (DUF5916)/Carbohydrate family 9 binding domain-like